MQFAELLLATTGILSTSIGAGIYLTGALHDIERDEPLKELPELVTDILFWWVPDVSMAKPKAPPPVSALEQMREKAFAPQSKRAADREQMVIHRALRGGTGYHSTWMGVPFKTYDMASKSFILEDGSRVSLEEVDSELRFY